jgi:hypothetical protein
MPISFLGLEHVSAIAHGFSQSHLRTVSAAFSLPVNTKHDHHNPDRYQPFSKLKKLTNGGVPKIDHLGVPWQFGKKLFLKFFSLPTQSHLFTELRGDPSLLTAYRISFFDFKPFSVRICFA